MTFELVSFQFQWVGYFLLSLLAFFLLTQTSSARLLLSICLISVGPIPKLNLSVLGIVSSTVPDSDNKVFIGGLPYNLTDEQVKGSNRGWTLCWYVFVNKRHQQPNFALRNRRRGALAVDVVKMLLVEFPGKLHCTR